MAELKSTIYLCNVPITPVHQLYFTARDKQDQYFTSKIVYAIMDCKYQPRNGTLRIKKYVEELDNVNYGFYRNTYQGKTKTFYFWILARNLISKNTTELTIQIDVIQTWMWEMDFNPCMIESAHVPDDTLGKHTIPEDFELGPYITINRYKTSELIGDICYFIAVTDPDNGNIGGRFGKIYSGFALRYYAASDSGQLTSYIEDLCEAGKADAIAFIFTFPQRMLNEAGLSLNSGDRISGADMLRVLVNYTGVQNYFEFGTDSYTPYNNKTLCYPFRMLVVTTPNGNTITLHLEDFEGSQIQFYLDGILCQNPKFTLTPANYAGKDFAIEDSIELQGYPLCSWNNDNYGNWYANNVNSIRSTATNATNSYHTNALVAENSYNNALQNAGTTALTSTISNAAGAINSIASLNAGGLISAGANQINTGINYSQAQRNAANDLSNSALMNTNNYLNTMRSLTASVKDAQVQPNTAKGDTTVGGLDVSRDTNTFFISIAAIKPEYARIIDMQFQVYGYKLLQTANPSLFFHNRERWNFIKTVNCSIKGNVPDTDKQAIQEFFNNGFTWWHKEEYMYNYNIKNEIRE